jgi:hypothetical protein
MSIIKVENLSKRYIIGNDRGATGMFRYKSLRDSLTHLGRSAYQRLREACSRRLINCKQPDSRLLY